MSKLNNNIIDSVMDNIWTSPATFNSDKPDLPIEGDMYFDSKTNRMMVYTGNKWVEITITSKNAEGHPLNERRMNKIDNLFK